MGGAEGVPPVGSGIAGIVGAEVFSGACVGCSAAEVGGAGVAALPEEAAGEAVGCALPCERKGRLPHPPTESAPTSSVVTRNSCERNGSSFGCIDVSGRASYDAGHHYLIETPKKKNGDEWRISATRISEFLRAACTPARLPDRSALRAPAFVRGVGGRGGSIRALQRRLCGSQGN